MDDLRIAVVGIGATGAVLSAALLKQDPETVLVGSSALQGESLKKHGIKVSGELTYNIPVRHFCHRIETMASHDPNLVFISTKTFHLPQIVEDLKKVFQPETKIVSTHNGLGTEDVIAEAFGPDAAFRMSMNFGSSRKGAGEVEVAFFNRPNHLGSLTEENRQLGSKIADLLTQGGLDTECVDDIKLYVWKKMVMKCTMASLCAVTDRNLKSLIDFPPTREIAEGCFKEVLAVAKAEGYDLGDDYVKNAFGYLEKVGAHKDSICYDISHKAPTEIDFLGGKVVEYARKHGIPVPYYIAMTNLVKSIEDCYLRTESYR